MIISEVISAIDIIDSTIMESKVNIQIAIDNVDDKHQLLDENYTIQESYPSSIIRQRRDYDRMINAGNKTNIKKIVRLCTAKNGVVDMRSTDDMFDRNAAIFKNNNISKIDYKNAFDYMRSLFDTYIASGGMTRLTTQKKLFEMCGIKDPKSHIVIIPTRYYDNQTTDIYFTILKSRQVNRFIRKPTTRFLHFSNSHNIGHLNPTAMSREFSSHYYIYPEKRCFFFAIDESDINNEFLGRAKNVYGNIIFEYKPSKSDIFYIDTAEHLMGKGQPVFIKTDESLAVTDVTNDINNIANNQKATNKADAINFHNIDDYKSLELFKNTEEMVMYSLKAKQNAKSISSGNSNRLMRLKNMVEDDIKYNMEYINNTKAESMKNWPTSKSVVDKYDNLKKIYKKKATALVKEIENIIRKNT